MSQDKVRPDLEIDDVNSEDSVEIKSKTFKGKKAKTLLEGDVVADSEVGASSATVDQPKEPVKTPRVPNEETHEKRPKFLVMIFDAISALKERSGSSRQAIVKYISQKYKLDSKAADTQVQRALRNGVTKGLFIQTKGTGASGSFKINKENHKKVKKPAKAVVKKAPKKPVKKSSKTKAKKAVKKNTPKKTKKSADKKTKNKKTLKPAPKKTKSKPKAKV